MNKEQIKIFLEYLGQKPASDQARTGWVISRCPLGLWRHDNGQSNPQAFAIKVEAGDSFCNCFSCGYHGRQSDLVMEIRHLNRHIPMEHKPQIGAAFDLILTAENEIELAFGDGSLEEQFFGKPSSSDDNYVFPEDWLATFPMADTFSWSRDYLLGRNVSLAMMQDMDLRADPKRRRVCCPVRDFHGRLRGLHGRLVDDDPSKLRYFMYKHNGFKNPIVWLGEHWVNVNNPIVIVEGFFDVASVRRVYKNVVSPLYVSPSFVKLKRMADAVHWVTLLDSGMGGDKGRDRIAKALPGHIIEHLLPIGKDPGAMSVQDLKLVLQEIISP